MTDRPDNTRKTGLLEKRHVFMERLGRSVFRRLDESTGAAEEDDEIHILDVEERKNLLRIQRMAILRAALAGAIAAALAALGEVRIELARNAGEPILGMNPEVGWWVAISLIALVTTLPELIYLYANTLRSVHGLTRAAGLPLFAGDDEEDERRTITSALARAALEVPNPRRPLFGVDPKRETSKLRLILAAVVYRLKVSVTNFIAKAILRRLLGRVILRAWVPIIAVPLTAAWDAMITWKVLREARIRVMGPSAAKDLVDRILGGENLRDVEKEIMFRAVAASIVRTRDLHPNLRSLLSEVTHAIGGVPDVEQPDDPEIFVARLREVDDDAQNLGLITLSIAAVIDGRLGRAERELVTRAQGSCGRIADCQPVRHIAREFVRGNGIDEMEIRALVSRIGTPIAAQAG